jgi:hypothetical protein
LNKQILTLATGKILYVKLAINLARSFHYWNKGSNISFIIVTDLPELIEDDVLNYIHVITIPVGKFGSGFSPKIHLDELVPIGSTLFIDSDCLIFGKIDPIFDKFSGHSVAVVGSYISKGDWYGNIKSLCERLKVPHIPKFNGGLYYLESGEEAKRIYKTARDLEKEYDCLGLQKFRNKAADEIIMSVAMQLHSVVPIPDDGKIMSDPFACPGNYKIDIKNGKTSLVNPPAPNPLHRPWYKFHKVSPIIVHFLGAHTNDYQYKVEVAKLPLLLTGRFDLYQKLKILLQLTIPELGKIYFKNIFRPLYKYLFGNRKIHVSERL